MLGVLATCVQNSNFSAIFNQLCQAIGRALSTIGQTHALPDPALGTALDENEVVSASDVPLTQ